MTDELNEPLGHGVSQRPSPPRVSRRLYAGAALVALGALGVALLPRDPYGGEPHAVARIEPAKAPEAAPPPAVATADAARRRIASRSGRRMNTSNFPA